MKLLRTLAFLMLLPTAAFAQDDIDIGHIIGGGKYHGARTADNQTIVPVLGVDASGNTVMNCLSSKECQIAIAKTPIAKISSDGLTFTSSAYQVRNTVLPPVMTPMTAITPVAGAALVARVSLMATASPTLAIVTLPAATANAGESFGVYNKGASPLLMVANGVLDATDVINALGAAGTPYSCATAKFCDCRVIGAGTYMCVSQ